MGLVFQGIEADTGSPFSDQTSILPGGETAIAPRSTCTSAGSTGSPEISSLRMKFIYGADTTAFDGRLRLMHSDRIGD
jgi:hypothetical protein